MSPEPVSKSATVYVPSFTDDFQRLFFVLCLRQFVQAGGDDSSGKAGDANGRIRGVDHLAAVTWRDLPL